MAPHLCYGHALMFVPHVDHAITRARGLCWKQPCNLKWSSWHRQGMCLSAPTWLLQCLTYQHGSCFVTYAPRSSLFFVTLCIKDSDGPLLVPLRAPPQVEKLLIHFLNRKKLMSLDQHAGNFCPFVPVQRMLSFVMIHGVLIGHQLSFCLWGFFFTTWPLNWSLDDELCRTHCFYVHAYWKCTTVYVHFSSVSNNLASFISSERATATESQFSSFS